MDLVELRQAFEWTCENCGRDNFERAVMLDPTQLDEDELEDLRELFGVQEWQVGRFFCRPRIVECQFCQVEHEAVGVGSDEHGS